MKARIVALAACLLPLVACRTGTNYTAEPGPRYASTVQASNRPAGDPHQLRVVSFNVAFAKEVDRAIDLLRSEPALRGADVILLQEMDGPGTRRIADALGLRFVYYPAIRSHRTGRDFGNAVLSSWPIADDDRIVLPHTAFLRGTQRIATAATLLVDGTRVRVYSAHLGTPLEIGAGARREQLARILEDAAPYPHVIVGGDMNSHGIGDVAVDHGFAWPTRDGPKTTFFGRWDHVFVRGLLPPHTGPAAGTVRDARDASDHVPVWTVARIGERSGEKR